MAEDSDDLRDAIVLVLIEQGYKVQAARDGHEATLMFPEFNPDIVVLDMRMPKLSGPNTCAAIRKISNVPVIMFTSTNDAAEVHDAISKGATDFVLKSTGVAELTERLATRLNEAPSSPATKTVPASPPKQIKSTTLIVDPDEANRDIIKKILTRLNQDSIEASTAAEAVSLFKQHKPDIVMTEWRLPDKDGIKLFSELTGRKFFKLMMTNRLSPEAQIKAHYVGITNFLEKPLNPAKTEIMVADCVRQAIRAKKRKAGRAA